MRRNRQNESQNQKPSVPFHILTKPIGPVCNLDCRYCYYLDKNHLYPQVKNFRMQPDVLDSFIQQYIEAEPAPVVSFGWQGGEPTLLGVEFFEDVVRLQKKYCPEGKRIENSIQTNGTLLNEEWCSFLRENNFLVGLSIDGPRELHDSYRVDKSGRGSFDRVLSALRMLRDSHVDFNVLTVVQRTNARHPKEVYRFFRDEGVKFIQFIPLVKSLDDCEGRLSDETPTPKAFGEFLCGVFDEWLEGDDIGKIFVQIFDVSLAAWLGLPSPLCVHGKTCGRALLLEHNGDLYSCDHFVYPENLLGNILETPLAKMVESPRQIAFGQSKKNSLPEKCRSCDVLFVCRGGCLKDRICKTSSGKPGLNYLCKGYRLFFRHIRPTMERMASEMKEAEAQRNRAQDRAGGILKAVGRNDPCPCGSGRKYKRCCGARRR